MPAESRLSADDRLPVAAVCLIWAATAAAVAFMRWASLDDAFASPDNAMRLAEVRAFLTDTALPWLERVPLPDGNVLRMWRVRG
jgi:hypothetical protein